MGGTNQTFSAGMHATKTLRSLDQAMSGGGGDSAHSGMEVAVVLWAGNLGRNQCMLRAPEGQVSPKTWMFRLGRSFRRVSCVFLSSRQFLMPCCRLGQSRAITWGCGGPDLVTVLTHSTDG